MPHDPERIAETRSWFAKASEDLRAAPLTEYAWRFRYPGDLDEPPVEEAREALTIATEVFEVLLTRLPSDVRP